MGKFARSHSYKDRSLWHAWNQKNKYISKKRDKFENVIWVTVSSDSSITSLQDKIADQLHFSYLNDDDDAERAFKLCTRLEEKKRFVLILDDLWDVYAL